LGAIYSSFDAIPVPGAWISHGTWATIGSFDGVHLGHQALIQRLVAAAHHAGQPAIVVTFWPNPAVVLRNIQGPFYLNSPQERESLLYGLGVDRVITLSFDRSLASLSATDFMQHLKEHLGVRHLLIGQNFALGRGREGNPVRLEEIGRELDYSIEVFPHLALGEKVVSSSVLRSHLFEGAVDLAAQGLGRYYAVSGEVIHGDGRGHSLGIPTANLPTSPEKMLPGIGVYAGWAIVDNQSWKAVANIGYRPTFEDIMSTARLEVHLIDFQGDLYGRTMRFEFAMRLRGEQRFPSIQLLLSQIEQDIQSARSVLDEGKGHGII
jgi:riboflavin kinase/FMN adenylyltransferase